MREEDVIAVGKAERLSWTIARHVADMAAGTIFAASNCAVAGVRLSQELLGCKLYLCGRGGAYDLAGILSIHARHWLFNRRPHAHVSLPRVFETLSEPHALLATPAQIDGAANANLSCIGEHASPRVAFGGTRGLPDAKAVHFVLPSHGARQLVERVDFVSTCATTRDQPPMLFTELCVMRWDRAGEIWRLEAVAPDTDPATVAGRTGFQFAIADDLAVMDDPPAEAMDLFDRIDPLRLRSLDFITGRKEILDAIADIYEREAALVGGQLARADRTPSR